MEIYSQPTLNISDCVTIKLTERNYLLWKSQFEAFLSGQGLLGFINGAFKKPLPDHVAWTRSDQIVLSWLLGSLSEDILSFLFSVV